MKKVIDKFKTYNPSNKEMLLYLLLPIILSFFACKVISNDFWFIINIGRYITNHGFFYIDPFTIHEGLHVVVQQWPVDLIFYHIYNFFGINGIYILILILFFIIMTLIYIISKMISNNTKLSIFITTLVSLLLLLFRFIETRPQLFDYIFLLLEIYILEKYIRSNNKKILFLLPLISILFINFHASTWIMLILFMVPYLIDSFRFKLGIFRGEGYKKRYLFLVFILVIIGGFVNPYGVDAITYAFNGTSNVINNYVKEMKPIYDWGLFPMLIVIISIIFSISSYIKKGTIRIRYY